MNTNQREAFISTLHSDHPIKIESIKEDHFFFLSDFEVPLQVQLFLKDPQEAEKGIKNLKKFEVVEFQKKDGKYLYYAKFAVNRFDFAEWEKNRRKKN